MALLRPILLLAAACVLVTEARPRYVLVPLEDIPLVRHTRSTRQYQPAQSRSAHDYQGDYIVPVVRQDYVEEESLLPQASDSYHRQADGYGQLDHVDYGAYTGNYGAFGWYSDHPVCINCGHYH